VFGANFSVWLESKWSRVHGGAVVAKKGVRRRKRGVVGGGEE
jgi:hypothetical protein